MRKMKLVAPVLAGFAGTTSAFAVVVVNFEPPTYSAGQDINSGQDGWIAFNSADGVVTPDFISGYVPPAYPILEGTQSFVQTHNGAYARGWGAAASQVNTSAVLSSLFRTELDATGGEIGFYLSDNIAAGSTPAGIVFNNVNDRVELAGSSTPTITSFSFSPATTYKIEMELDFNLDQFSGYITDVTNAGSRVLLGTKAFFGDVSAATTAATGGIALFRSGNNNTAFFVDDINLVLPTPGWKNNASGDWNLSTNWVGGVPNSTSATAAFGNVILSPQTVYTNSAVTVGTMTFDSANTYVIAGAGSLTIDASGTALVSVAQGSHKINLPTIFASDTNINVASGATLTLGNPVVIKAGKLVTKTGNVVIQAPLSLEADASLSLGPGPAATVFGAPSLASGAKINVQNNALLIDYRGQTSPATTIKAQLASGYNGGAWNGAGINTSSATAARGLGWVDSGSSESIQIRYTYYGDTDLSGTVTSTDFNAFIAGYGLTSGAVWAQGDFDYDGKVSTKDFNFLAGNFGAAPIGSAALGSVVPEPAGMSLLLGGVLMLARRRRSIHF